jgi:hypothetical protein
MRLTPQQLSDHAYALEASGYTMIGGAPFADRLEALRAAADRGLAAVRAAYARGQAPLHDNRDNFFQARCLYVWGAAMVELLEDPLIHALAEAIVGPVRLMDQVVTLALPADSAAGPVTSGWHRDYEAFHVGSQPPTHLWFFIPLDRLTAANGATWVVPGSHRRCQAPQPAIPEGYSSDDLERFPARIQLVAEAGDLVVVNPSLVHSSGRNRTGEDRRLLNVGLASAELRPLFDHWAIAGPALQGRLGPCAKMLMDGGPAQALSFWPTLPDGWVSGGNAQRLQAH